MQGLQPTRRFFIKGGLTAGGGLVVGFVLPDALAQDAAKRVKRQGEAGISVQYEVNAWIVVQADEKVVVRVARSEMGQGTLTGLAQLAAEEMDCDWSRVGTELVSPRESLRRKRPWGDFATSNSRSIRTMQMAMRQAGAAARRLLVDAAANTWRVAAAEITAEAGVLRHVPSGRSVSFGRMAVAAAQLPPRDASNMRLKDRQAWRVIGQPLPSLDVRPKLSGTAIYGIDVRLPGMLNAAIRAAPIHGGKLGSFDGKVAEIAPGVRRVLAVGDDAVAVVADSWWQAKTALDKVDIVWAPAQAAGISSESIARFLKTGIETQQETFVGRTHGDALEALRGATQTVEAVYATPFLHHATLEPMNATALWQPDRAEVWVPTQNAEAAQLTAAEAAGLAPEHVDVHRTMAGGSFGRRLKQDFVRQAMLIAREMPGVPVKLIWSREEDTTHGHYRPVTQAKLTGGLDDKGEPTGLIIRISGQSILAANLARGAQAGRDPRMFQGLFAQPGEAQMGYSVPNVFIDHAMRNTHLPVGSWRGVHTSQNGVYLECFIDELAFAAKRDPLEFRRGLLKGHPAHIAVLTAATEKAGWGTPPPAGVHRGLGQVMAVGSYSAVVAEVMVQPEGTIQVIRVVVALDCGNVVNPNLVSAQLEGAVAMALSATLHEEITIRGGQIIEQNFDTYRVLRLREMPKVETVLVPSGEFWGGVGDAAIGAVAPAVLNAIFAATGKRVRTLPLKNVRLNAAR